jgi:hypothetical protein
MDLVEVKQRQLLERARLPLSDIMFLRDTRLFDADDLELHRCSVQRSANYLTEDLPLPLLLAPEGPGNRVLDARIFAAPEEEMPLRFSDVIGRNPTVVLTVSVT